MATRSAHTTEYQRQYNHSPVKCRIRQYLALALAAEKVIEQSANIKYEGIPADVKEAILEMRFELEQLR